MRKSSLILLTILAFLLPTKLSAGEGVENCFSLSATGGYSNYITTDSRVKPLGFLGATGGLGYEMQVPNRKFWWSFAAEFEVKSAVLKGTTDSLGNEYPHLFYISLPILLGYKNNNFYFGIGPKLTYNFFGRSVNQCNGQMTITAGNNTLNGAVCFEIGGILIDNTLDVAGFPHYQLKMGFYAEYHILNANLTFKKSMVETNPIMAGLKLTFLYNKR